MSEDLKPKAWLYRFDKWGADHWGLSRVDPNTWPRAKGETWTPIVQPLFAIPAGCVPVPVPTQVAQDVPSDELEGIRATALRAIQDRNVLLDAAIAALDDLIADGHAHYRVADVLREAIAKAEGRSNG